MQSASKSVAQRLCSSAQHACQTVNCRSFFNACGLLMKFVVARCISATTGSKSLGARVRSPPGPNPAVLPRSAVGIWSPRWLLPRSPRASIRYIQVAYFKSLSAPAPKLGVTGRPTSVEFDHYNISNQRANLDIGSVAIAQQLRSAPQDFLSTKKHPRKRIPVETLEGTPRREQQQLLYKPSTRGATSSYICLLYTSPSPRD